MTTEESAALMQDPTFRGRVKVCCIRYADAVLIQPPGLGHVSLVKWSQTVFNQPDMIAGQVQPFVVNDPAVQTEGAAIADAALQTAVETVINKTI